MLLRASGEREETTYDLNAVTRDDGDGGVAHGDVLRRLIEPAIRGDWNALIEARDNAANTLGAQAMVDALTVAAGFNGITRVADATGIPLDAQARDSTDAMRAETGIDNFDYAAKTARYEVAAD